jgi:hypothetical protein
MKTSILIGCIFLSNIIIAQKFDYIWLWTSNTSSDPGIESNVVNFNNGTRTVSKDTTLVDLDQVNNTICDKDGKLLFYFNGCNVVGADHALIENGDSINYSDWWASISNCKSGYTGPGNTLILPDPAKENGYYIIHKTVDWVQFPTRKTITALGLKSTYVDMNANNGNGKVVYKNKWVFQDTMMWGYLHAVKHSNGRDWWLVDLKKTIPDGSKSNTHYIFKLDNTGFSKVRSQNFGQLFNEGSSSAGSSKFSPDGTRWVYHCVFDGFWMLDFDREKGEFSNYKYYSLNHKQWGGGLEWSANGRFIYLSTLDSLFQYDTWATDFKASEVLIDVWDKTSNPGQTVFALMQRGPDCRIYISSRSSTKTIHVINNPDEPGKLCNFVQHDLKLYTSTGTISMPIFPNYRLDSGPVCDPGITVAAKDIATLPHTDIRLYPNPATDLFYIESSYEYKDAKVNIIDMGGKTWWQGEHHKTMSFGADQFAAGVYVVQLEHKGKVLGVEKLVVVR